MQQLGALVQAIVSGEVEAVKASSTATFGKRTMHVGTLAAGRIGLAVLRRLKPFDMHLHYTDRHRLPKHVEQELGLTFHNTAADMLPLCDVVTINAPLHPETENLFDDKMLARMKRGAYLINTARAKICNRDAIVRALEGGQLGGYAMDDAVRSTGASSSNQSLFKWVSVLRKSSFRAWRQSRASALRRGLRRNQRPARATNAGQFGLV